MFEYIRWPMQSSMNTNLYPFFIQVQNRVEEYQAETRFVYFFAFTERTKPNIISSINSTADFATCVSNYISIIEKKYPVNFITASKKNMHFIFVSFENAVLSPCWCSLMSSCVHPKYPNIFWLINHGSMLTFKFTFLGKNFLYVKLNFMGLSMYCYICVFMTSMPI